MSYATQVTIVTGRKGRRSSKSFILGATTRGHRDQVREILDQEAFDKIEADGFDGGLELDGLKLTVSLQTMSCLIDAIADEGLRTPFQDFRDYWLSLDDRDDAFAIAELTC